MRSFRWLLPRLIVLGLLFPLFFILGAAPLARTLPPMAESEPGLVSAEWGLALLTLVNVLLITALVLSSRWHGWKLAIALALVYYCVTTLLTQLETWYFLSTLTVARETLVGLFLMGIPTAFVFVPLAVRVLGKWHVEGDPAPRYPLNMRVRQWAWKVAVLVLAYVFLYWAAGYFIAWQNPELRAFYGRAGDSLPFLTHTVDAFRRDPLLFPLQIFRAFLWILCGLVLVRGSRANPWQTALLVGLLFSAPQNVAHVLANPLMPIASVRLSHMIETASSTFIFGALLVWLMHREHRSLRELFGLQSPAERERPPLHGSRREDRGHAERV